MPNFSDNVVQGLVEKIKTLKLTAEEKELLNHLFDAASALSDEELEGAAGGIGVGPSPLPRHQAPGMPDSGPAAKLRRF